MRLKLFLGLGDWLGGVNGGPIIEGGIEASAKPEEPRNFELGGENGAF